MDTLRTDFLDLSRQALAQAGDPDGQGLSALQQVEQAPQDSWFDEAVNALSQLPTGFWEGFTTLEGGNAPKTKAAEVMRGIGHLLGFIGFIPDPTDLAAAPAKAALLYGSKGLKTAAAKRITGKAVKKGLLEESAQRALLSSSDDLIRKAEDIAGMAGYGQLLQGVVASKFGSVPLYVAGKAQKGLNKLLDVPFVSNGSRAATALLKNSKAFKNAETMGILTDAGMQAFHLGVASGVSGLGINPFQWGERVDQAIGGLAGGAVMGGAFGLIGNIGRVSTKLILDGKQSSAEHLLRTVAGAAVSGLPSTLQGRDTVDQVYDYLLGGYFGFHATPWTVNQGRAHAKVAFDANKQVSSAILEGKEYGRFAEITGVNTLREMSPTAGDIMMRELLILHGVPKAEVAKIMRDPNKYVKTVGNEEVDATARASADEAAKTYDAIVKQSDEWRDWPKQEIPKATDTPPTIDPITVKVSEFKKRDVLDETVKPTTEVPPKVAETPSVMAEPGAMGPARRLSGRDIAERFYRSLESSAKDYIKKPDGTELPEARDLWEKATIARLDGQAIRGRLADAREEVVRIAASPKNVGELARMRKPIEIGTTGVGDTILARGVEDASYRSTLTGVQREAVDGVMRLNIETAKVGEEGRWATITREKPDGTKEVTEHGMLIQGKDGHFRPFTHGEGDRLVRFGTPFGNGFWTLGPENPLVKNYLDVAFKNQKNVEAGITREQLDQFARDMKDLVESVGPMRQGGTGHVAMEFSRKIPYLPSAVKTRFGGWEEIYTSNPVEYANRIVESHSSRIAYNSQFGQGVNDKYIDPVTGDRITVSSPDKWDGYRRKLEETHGKSAMGVADALQRTLNGLPLERALLPAGTPIWYAARAYEDMTGILQSLMLSGASIANVSETLFGNVPAFFGFRFTLKAMKDYLAQSPEARKMEYSYLDQQGAVSRNILDLSWNPNHPITSAVRIGRQLSGRAFLHTYLNELQEFMAAAVAHGKVKAWRKGMTGKYDVAMLKNMGMFSEAQIKELVSGKANSNLEEDFIRSVAQYFTAAPLARARESMAGLSPAFSKTFPFLAYGRMKMQVFSDAAKGVIRAHEELKRGGDDGYRLAAKTIRSVEAQLLGRSVGFTTAQGVGGVLLLALAFGGPTGLSIALNEAENEPAKFLTEAFVYSAITGPFAQAVRYATDPNDPPSMVLAKSMFPGSLLDETHAMLSGQGAYKDRTPFERAVEFFRRKTPITGPFATGLAVMGLSDRDAALEGAIRGYWKWRFEEARPGRVSPGAASEEDKWFRQAMRRAMDKIRKNQDPSKDVADALAVDGKNAQAAKQSILSRRLLKPLDAVEQEALRRRIGDKGFAKLQAYEELLESWADKVA